MYGQFVLFDFYHDLKILTSKLNNSLKYDAKQFDLS